MKTTTLIAFLVIAFSLLLAACAQRQPKLPPPAGFTNLAPDDKKASDGIESRQANSAEAPQATPLFAKPDGTQSPPNQLHIEQLYDLKINYADFFQKHPMDDDKKNIIYIALIRQKISWNNFIIQYLSYRKQNKESPSLDRQSMSEETQKLEQQLVMDLKPSFEADIVEALLYYTHTLPQRDFAHMIAERMSAANRELTPGQIDQLVDIFRRHYVARIKLSDAAQFPLSIKSQASAFARNERVIMMEAARILNQKQMDVLRQIWASVSNQSANINPIINNNENIE